MIQTNASPTLDGLFKRILARKPDALALRDPLNKQRVTGQPPRNLTFAEADRAITALSAHFIESGLPSNSVIAVQLPNTVEFVLTVLAAHRAGLVVALFPLLWRQAELTVALNRTGARAIVSIEQDRWRRACRSRHECRGRSLFDPPCLRFRQRSAGRHGLARSCPVDRFHHLARRGAGRPQGGD